MIRRTPIATLTIALAAVVATYIPSAGQWLVYDRAAIIDGQIWRLVTGHLYHYSTLHLWFNLVPWVLIGACVERQRGWWFSVGCGVMATAIGAGLCLTRPYLAQFGGLSGLVCGALTYFGASGARNRDPMGLICRMTLAALFFKIGYELYMSDAWLANWDAHGFVVMPLSHIVGCLSALFLILVEPVAASTRIKSADGGAPVG